MQNEKKSPLFAKSIVDIFGAIFRLSLSIDYKENINLWLLIQGQMEEKYRFKYRSKLTAKFQAGPVEPSNT